MYVYIYIYMFICIYVYIYIFVSVYVCIFLYMYACRGCYSDRHGSLTACRVRGKEENQQEASKSLLVGCFAREVGDCS